jgi:hypothetical protein
MHLGSNSRALVLGAAVFLLFAPMGCGTTDDNADGGRDGGTRPDAPEGSAPDVAIDVNEPDAHPTIEVTMNGYTPGGSGANTKETYLNVSNVGTKTFGKLFSRSVDGDQFAQPLYMGGLKMPDHKTHNVVFLATSHDSVYAYDADDPTATKPLWQKSLGTATPLPSPYLSFQWTRVPPSCSTFPLRESGITATPVIDPKTNTMYVFALNVDMTKTTPGGTCLDVTSCSGTPKTHTCDAPKVSYQLHALDLFTGSEKFGGPVDVEATIPGTGTGSQSGKLSFDAGLELARVSLLLANGSVYFGAGSYSDAGNYHGWLFAYDAATLKQTGVWNPTADGARAGLWQAGRGPIADADGNIYLVTGQGTFDVGTGGNDYGDSVVKLSPDLSKVNDYFAQFLSDYQTNNFPDQWDDDLGSSGATLIPKTSLILVSGKMGNLYLLDTNSLGHWSPTGDKVVQKLRMTWRTDKTSCTDGVPEAWVYSTPITWVGPDGTHVYVWANGDYLREFLLDGSGKFKDSGDLCWCDPWVVIATSGSVSVNVSDPNCASPHSQGTVPGGPLGAGGALAVSSNASEAGTGLLWATYASSPTANAISGGPMPGTLAAYDATNAHEPIWLSTSDLSRDDLGTWAKWTPPTVANGKVYAATFSNQLVVYGLLAK